MGRTNTIDRIMRSLLDFLYPPRCGLCGLWDQPPLCDVCRSDFVWHPNDDAPAEPLDFRHCLLTYEGRARQAVHRLKFDRVLPLAGPMGSLLAEALAQGIGFSYDVIVPVPIHWTRRNVRGFNQAEVLCESLVEEEVRPRLLTRVRATRPQSTLTLAERHVNLGGAFICPESPAGLSVLLVDDVVTSGATAMACAQALKAAGASAVGIIAFAGGDAGQVRGSDGQVP